MQAMKFITIILLCISIVSCDSDKETTTELPPAGISIDSLVRRVVIPAQSMGKVFNAYVLLPESYLLDSTLRSYPVLYLLHGHTGDFSDWYEKVPKIRNLASQYDMIVVTPEGGH